MRCSVMCDQKINLLNTHLLFNIYCLKWKLGCVSLDFAYAIIMLFMYAKTQMHLRRFLSDHVFMYTHACLHRRVCGGGGGIFDGYV